MTRDDQHNPDPNKNAARTVAEATASDSSVPADVEVAWLEWSSHIQSVDDRQLELLRAAFEAGYSNGVTKSRPTT